MSQLKANFEEHFETDECWNWHCTVHAVDEVTSGRKLVIRCFECGHLYRSPRELRKTFRSEVIDKLKYPWHITVWLKLTLRVNQINFCPHCAHDF